MLPPDSRHTRPDPLTPVNQAPLRPHQTHCLELPRKALSHHSQETALSQPLTQPSPERAPLILAQLPTRPPSPVPLPYLSSDQASPGFSPSRASLGCDPPAHEPTLSPFQHSLSPAPLISPLQQLSIRLRGQQSPWPRDEAYAARFCGVKSLSLILLSP